MRSTRPWFQFHLTTAIVLMFVAGGLLWANLIPSRGPYRDTPGIESRCYGWPLWCYWTISLAHDGDWSEVSPDAAAPGCRIFYSTKYNFLWQAPGPAFTDTRRLALLADVHTAILVLAVCTLTLEWFIRRRERRQ